MEKAKRELDDTGCDRLTEAIDRRHAPRLDLESDVPDHSTLSKNRHGRFRESGLLRGLFETTLRRCIDEGLVGGSGVAVDARPFKADANRQRSAAASEPVDRNDLARTRRSVRERLDTLDPIGARDEFHLAASAQNLREFAKLASMPVSAPA